MLRHTRQEPWRTDEPVWLGSFFRLWFGDCTGQTLLSLQKKAPHSPGLSVSRCSCPTRYALGDSAQILCHPGCFDFPGPSPPGRLSSYLPRPPRSPSVGTVPPGSQLSSFKVNIFPPDRPLKHLSGQEGGCGLRVYFLPVMWQRGLASARNVSASETGVRRWRWPAGWPLPTGFSTCHE